MKGEGATLCSFARFRHHASLDLTDSTADFANLSSSYSSFAFSTSGGFVPRLLILLAEPRRYALRPGAVGRAGGNSHSARSVVMSRVARLPGPLDGCMTAPFTRCLDNLSRNSRLVKPLRGLTPGPRGLATSCSTATASSQLALGPTSVPRDAVAGGPIPALLPKLLCGVSIVVVNVFLPPWSNS